MPIPQPSPETAPFVVEHRRLPEPGGRFVPAASVSVTTALRTSGLLAHLPDEAGRPLLALLAFLSPNGTIAPSLPELAEALGMPEGRARERLRRLAAVPWRGEPLAVERPRESGLAAYALSRTLFEEREAPAPPSEVVSLPIPSARERIVAHSRATYTVPRAEAERQVLAQMGAAPEEAEDTPEGEARRRLLALGVSRDQVEALLARHPASLCLRQLDWLPYRSPKNAARLAVAAIEGDYAPPAALRRELEAGAGAPEEQEEGGPMAGAGGHGSSPEYGSRQERAPEDPAGTGLPGGGVGGAEGGPR